MSISVGIIVTALTLLAGEITKLLNVDSKWIPLQNIIITILASIVCIVFNVENMSALETILTCVFATMGAGGIYDLSKLAKNKENKGV